MCSAPHPSLSPTEIFKRYRAERRHQPIPGFICDALPHLSRYSAATGSAEGFVVFARLDHRNVEQQIDEQISHFDRLGQNFEWKVYDLDAPPNLKALLESRGFSCEHAEAFMVLPVDDWPVGRRDSAIKIEKVTREQLPAFVALEGEIWPDVAGHLERYARELETQPESMSIYRASFEGRPAGTGRVSYLSGATFADLNGGGVHPSLRGRGIFTALLSCRIEEARARGYRWVAVDAAPMSHPILTRKGFQHVCWTYPMLRRPKPLP